jgi:hypothetical protein
LKNKNRDWKLSQVHLTSLIGVGHVNLKRIDWSLKS